MKATALIALVLASAAGSFVASPLHAAQLYRWVDEKGNVEWRDTPPPAHAKKVEQRNVTGNTIDTSSLPFSVQQAVKNNPVTLWIYDCGDPCTDARAHLARRGVPHTERNSQKDLEGLKKVTGGTEVPVLLVGSQQLKGYLETTWDTALDAAGYPRTPPPGQKARDAAAGKAGEGKPPVAGAGKAGEGKPPVAGAPKGPPPAPAPK